MGVAGLGSRGIVGHGDKGSVQREAAHHLEGSRRSAGSS